MEVFDSLTFPQVRSITTLGALPLIVLTAGKTAEQVPVQIELHQEFAALSSNSAHLIVDGASHANLVTNPNFVPLVAAAIGDVLLAAQTGTSLQTTNLKSIQKVDLEHLSQSGSGGS